MSDDYTEEEEEIEAYCVSCRGKVVMENPSAVYTRRGAPGTRGTCPDCGATVFRMGRTDAHTSLAKPDLNAIRPEGAPTPGSKKAGGALVYVNYAPGNTDFAQRLATDLDKMGIAAWVDFDDTAEDVAWASGVHPAIDECTHMILVLSEVTDEHVFTAWEHFRERRKPVVVAQLDAVDMPDDLRSRPRYDFSQNYKSAFRKLLQSMMS